MPAAFIETALTVLAKTTLAACAAAALAACATGPEPGSKEGPISEALRNDALRNAEAWRPIDTATLDLRRGPPGSRDPALPLDCSFVVPQSRPGGHTPKFPCRDAEGRVHKVKYGPDNMEVHGEIFGSRLLWALGFHTDRVDPVRVRCRGCPEDPWDFLQGVDAANPRPGPPTSQVRSFAPAAVETYYGTRIQAHEGQGVPWPALLALRSHDPERARVQGIQREALTLLAAFLGHGDSKAENQTLACAPGSGEPTACQRPVVYIGDLGAILGRGFRVRTSKVDIEDWGSVDVWREPATCLARFDTHPVGTLFDTRISEPARAFLAQRLSALSTDQIRTLFEVAGLDGLGGEVEDPEDGTARPPRLDDWVAVFEAKRRQITHHTCP
jgi:hypothetical protein